MQVCLHICFQQCQFADYRMQGHHCTVFGPYVSPDEQSLQDSGPGLRH